LMFWYCSSSSHAMGAIFIL